MDDLTGDDGSVDYADVNVIPSNAYVTENAANSKPTVITLNVGIANGAGLEDDANKGANEIAIKHFELPSSMTGCNSLRKRLKVLNVG